MAGTEHHAGSGSAIADPVAPAVFDTHLADAARALALDSAATVRAEAGFNTGMADVATVLWTRYLKFDAADPLWADRDRVIASSTQAPLLRAVMHLTGHDGVGLDIAGEPGVAAIAASADPALATGSGLAIAERLLAGRFGRSLVDHRSWVITSVEEIADGVGHEAGSLAGQWQLAKLALLVEETGEAASRLASEEALRRFAGYGWTTRRVDGHDASEIAAALALALRSRRPTLIACATSLTEVAAEPAGALRRAAADLKRRLGWALTPFAIPAALAERWRAAGRRGATPRRAWLKRLARHRLRAEFERVVAGRLPHGWHEACASFKAALGQEAEPAAPDGCCLAAIEALGRALPELVPGMAGAAPDRPPARTLAWGARAASMAAAANGLALHGGVLPCVATPLEAGDQLRPALRAAALGRSRVVHLLTEGGQAETQDNRPVEHLAALRAMPNLYLMRPADPVETVECWDLAIRRSGGPSVLSLSRQRHGALRAPGAENLCARGGYVLAEAEGPRRATLIGSGPELAEALRARALLALDGLAVAVVSLPCWELFAHQDEFYREAVLGTAPRLGVEAASSFGWERWLGRGGDFIGAAATPEASARELTPEGIAGAVRRRIIAA